MGLTALARSAILESAASSVAPGVLQAAGPPGRWYLEKPQVSPSCILRAVHRNSSPCTPHFQPPFLTWGTRGLQSHAELVAEPRAAMGCLWFAEGLLEIRAIPSPRGKASDPRQEDPEQHTPQRAAQGQRVWGLLSPNGKRWP